MPLATTTVNGTITLPDGGGISTAIIAFSLVRFQTVSPYVIPTANKTANIAANGDFTVELAPNDPTQAPTYLVTLTVYNSSGAQVHFEKLGYIAVPDIGPVELADLIVLDPPESTQADALAQALAAAAAAAGQAVLAQGYADAAGVSATAAAGSATEAADSAAVAASYTTPYLDDVAAVLADTSLAYGAGAGQVQAGDFVRTRKEGFAYAVADSGVVDHDIETAGGVKLYETGTKYSSVARLQAAIARGDLTDLPQNYTVLAAGEVFLRDTSALWLPDIPGFKKANQGQDRITTTPSQGRARIEHKITASYGGIAYDVITVTGGPHVVRKRMGPDVDGAGVMLRRTPKQVAKLYNYPVVVNADLASAPDGQPWNTSIYGLNRGMQIADGIAYRDWQATGNQDYALVMMRDGDLRPAYRTDGETAQEWVDMGALWCTSGSWICVLNGAATALTGNTAVDVTLSARTIFGRKANGDFVIIVVEGLSGSYGIAGIDIANLAVAEGCDIAITLDGGGSSQAWWGNCYAMPSSDVPALGTLDEGRAVASWLCVDVPAVETYDSGIIPLATAPAITGASAAALPALFLRQVGPNVIATLNASTSTISTTAVLLTSTPIRPRYMARGTSLLRGVVATAASAVQIIASASGDGANLSARAFAGDTSALYGSWSWPLRQSE